MARKLNIAVNNDVMSIYDLTQNSATSKRIQVYVRFPVTPSTPYLYLTEGMTSGNYPVEEFLNACQKTNLTSIGAFVRFTRTSAGAIAATMQRSYIVGPSCSNNSGGRYTPTVFCKIGAQTNVSIFGQRVSYNSSLSGRPTSVGLYWRTS